MDSVEQIFEKVMTGKKWNKQQLAQYIGVHSSTLSQKLGTEWNNHWRVFRRLLPLLVELKIINPKELTMSDNSQASKMAQDTELEKKSQQKDDPITPIMSPRPNFSFWLQ
jgi:hypothetical protein